MVVYKAVTELPTMSVNGKFRAIVIETTKSEYRIWDLSDIEYENSCEEVSNFNMSGALTR